MQCCYKKESVFWDLVFPLGPLVVGSTVYTYPGNIASWNFKAKSINEVQLCMDCSPLGMCEHSRDCKQLDAATF